MPKLNPLQWVDLYGDYLYGLAYFRLNDEVLSEDLVQDTFLSALKAKDDYRGESSEKTWLTSILKNKIADVYRSEKGTMVEAMPDWENTLFENESNNTHWKKKDAPGDWSLNAEERVISKEFQQVLLNCLRKLNSLQQALIHAKFFDEKKGTIICKEQNLTPSNYWIMMHRVNLQLRKCLEINWYRLP